MRTKYEHLSRKQLEVWKALSNFVEQEGRFPSVRELARCSGRSSPATIARYLRLFEQKDLLERHNGRLTINKTSNSVPLVGIVPAGAARETFYPLEEELELPLWFRNSQEDFVALRVSGDSMVDAYIQDGDIVVIKKSSSADPEQMVIARTAEGEVTLKRLRRKEEGFYLAPENSAYQPIYGVFTILGIVIGVLRKYR